MIKVEISAASGHESDELTLNFGRKEADGLNIDQFPQEVNDILRSLPQYRRVLIHADLKGLRSEWPWCWLVNRVDKKGKKLARSLSTRHTSLRIDAFPEVSRDSILRIYAIEIETSPGHFDRYDF